MLLLGESNEQCNLISERHKIIHIPINKVQCEKKKKNLVLV